MNLINMEEVINTFNMDSKNYLKLHLDMDIIIKFMILTYFNKVAFLMNIINLELDIIITNMDLEHIDQEEIDLEGIDLEGIDLVEIDSEDMEDFNIDLANIINKIHFN